MLGAFRMLARYNRIANERLYDTCGQLDPVEYRRERPGSFGSIHGLLNHLLLGDRIWMSRFADKGNTTPPLNAILFDGFAELRSARAAQDEEIDDFFQKADDGFLARSLHYTNNQGRRCIDKTAVAVLHFFNHQTHHRGQVHVMISQTNIKPPALDLHRVFNP